MKNWKPLLEKALAKEYPGATIKWIGDDPTLVVPDALLSEANEIIEFVTVLWESWGGSVEFYPERAVRTGKRHA